MHVRFTRQKVVGIWQNGIWRLDLIDIQCEHALDGEKMVHFQLVKLW